MDLSHFLDYIFPNYCAGCGATLEGGRLVCTPCRASVTIRRSFFCAVCRRATLTHPPLCHPDPPYLLGAAGNYDDPLLENLVQALKFHFMKGAAEPLGDMLIEYFERAFPSPNLSRPVVIPIPLHRTRERMRGFNQSALIAARFAKHFGFEYAPATVVRRKATLPQSTLGKHARFMNIRNSFALTDPGSIGTFADRSVILIDDVITSGGTFREAAKIFKGTVLALAALKA